MERGDGHRECYLLRVNGYCIAIAIAVKNKMQGVVILTLKGDGCLL